MTITASQAASIVNRSKTAFTAIENGAKAAQSAASAIDLEILSVGAASDVTKEIPDSATSPPDDPTPGSWEALFPNFTKTEWQSAIANMRDAKDLLGSHGDLKPSLYRLKD